MLGVRKINNNNNKMKNYRKFNVPRKRGSKAGNGSSCDKSSSIGCQGTKYCLTTSNISKHQQKQQKSTTTSAQISKMRMSANDECHDLEQGNYPNNYHNHNRNKKQFETCKQLKQLKPKTKLFLKPQRQQKPTITKKLDLLDVEIDQNYSKKQQEQPKIQPLSLLSQEIQSQQQKPQIEFHQSVFTINYPIPTMFFHSNNNNWINYNIRQYDEQINQDDNLQRKKYKVENDDTNSYTNCSNDKCDNDNALPNFISVFDYEHQINCFYKRQQQLLNNNNFNYKLQDDNNRNYHHTIEFLSSLLWNHHYICLYPYNFNSYYYYQNHCYHSCSNNNNNNKNYYYNNHWVDYQELDQQLWSTKSLRLARYRFPVNDYYYYCC